MILSQCTDPRELIPFLKLDYANNLYFFTYLSENISQDIVFLTLKNREEIELVLLITPIHCCISTVNINHIFALAGQLSPINSTHVVGRQDFIEPLLNISNGAERDKHLYSLNEFTHGSVAEQKIVKSQKASRFHLNELIGFYNNNDMLIDAENRLPGILNWGRIYLIREDDKIVSCALTTTETSDAAMIGAVFTISEYRNKGYAKDCIMSLCRYLLINGKKPYLFYNPDNALLGSLYQSLGFQPISTWILASRIQNKKYEKGRPF